jgi:hypothetical protein
MEAPITIMQKELLSLSPEVHSQVHDKTWFAVQRLIKKILRKAGGEHRAIVVYSIIQRLIKKIVRKAGREQYHA